MSKKRNCVEKGNKFWWTFGSNNPALPQWKHVMANFWINQDGWRWLPWQSTRLPAQGSSASLCHSGRSHNILIPITRTSAGSLPNLILPQQGSSIKRKGARKTISIRNKKLAISKYNRQGPRLTWNNLTLWYSHIAIYSYIVYLAFRIFSLIAVFANRWIFQSVQYLTLLRVAAFEKLHRNEVPRSAPPTCRNQTFKQILQLFLFPPI